MSRANTLDIKLIYITALLTLLSYNAHSQIDKYDAFISELFNKYYQHRDSMESDKIPILNKSGTFNCTVDTINCFDPYKRQQGLWIYPIYGEDGLCVYMLLLDNGMTSCHLAFTSNLMYVWFQSVDKKNTMEAFMPSKEISSELISVNAVKEFIAENRNWNPKKDTAFSYKSRKLNGKYTLYKGISNVRPDGLKQLKKYQVR